MGDLNPRPNFVKIEKYQGIQQDDIAEYHAWCLSEAVHSSESVPTIRVKGMTFVPCITFERDTVKKMRYCPVCQSEAYPEDVDDIYCPRCASLGQKNKTYTRPGSSAAPTHPRVKKSAAEVVAAARYICGYKDKPPRALKMRYLEKFEVVNGKQVGIFQTELVEAADFLRLATIPKRDGEFSRIVDWRRTAQAGKIMFTDTSDADFRKVFTKYKNELVDSMMQTRIDSLKLGEKEIRNYCDRFGIPDFSFLTKNNANQILNENDYYRKEIESREEKPKEQPEELPEELSEDVAGQDEAVTSDTQPIKLKNSALMSVKELQEECRIYGISDEGTKQELVKRVHEQRKQNTSVNAG